MPQCCQMAPHLDSINDMIMNTELERMQKEVLAGVDYTIMNVRLV